MTQPAIEVCKCCGAVIPPKTLKLTGKQQALFDFVSQRPQCSRDQIYEHLYYDDETGGPDKNTISVMINQINKKLAEHNLRIRASNRGWWATYRLIKLEDPA